MRVFFVGFNGCIYCCYACLVVHALDLTHDRQKLVVYAFCGQGTKNG